MTSLLTRSVAVALLVGALSLACDGATGPPPFVIVTPDGTRVSVLPGATARFEVQIIDARLSAQYLVDGVVAQNGPVFDFLPTESEHTVTLRIESTEPGQLPVVRTFTVVVEVPGNLPPEILSSTFDPATNGEAQRDTFTFTITAADPDGAIASIALDFGDGSPPASGAGSPLVVPHVFSSPGTYTLKVTATDDVQIKTSTTFSLVVLPPNQLPTGQIRVNGISSGGPVDGDGPFTVRLATSGADVDGTVVGWEIDDDTGTGFRPIQPSETVEVVYPFRETTYRPVLRLTDDDGDAAEIPSAVEIRVFRNISPDESSATLSGNPQFDNLAIAPAVFANGVDPLEVDVEIRDPIRNPLPGTAVRLTAVRPPLVTPTGQNLGVPVSIEGGSFTTDAAGRGNGSVTTRTSTRVEAVPEVAFVPFDIRVEANKGHGVWMEVALLSGANAETTVSGSDGRPTIRPTGGQSFYCAGDVVEIQVDAFDRSGGPAIGKYTVVRYAAFPDMEPVLATPASGFTNWRTNGSGRMVFRYTPTDEDAGKAVIAWVDGQALDQFASFNFGASCP